MPPVGFEPTIPEGERPQTARLLGSVDRLYRVITPSHFYLLALPVGSCVLLTQSTQPPTQMRSGLEAESDKI